MNSFRFRLLQNFDEKIYENRMIKNKIKNYKL